MILFINVKKKLLKKNFSIGDFFQKNALKDFQTTQFYQLFYTLGMITRKILYSTLMPKFQDGMRFHTFLYIAKFRG